MDNNNAKTKNLLANVISHMNKFLETATTNIYRVEDAAESELDSGVKNSDEVVRKIRRLAEDLLELLVPYENANKIPKIDPSFVQITASKQQLNERISAFMSHAQNAVDEQNVKEFCNPQKPSDVPGCARTDACYKPRDKNSTHMQVSKASNAEGPQLQITSQGVWRSPPRLQVAKQVQKRSHVPQPIDERLCNLEDHLKLTTEDTAKSNVYTRLKRLEDRLLLIEGTSPEYFSNTGKMQPNSQVRNSAFSSHTDSHEFTLEEIDDRIRQLKQDLMAKKRKQDTILVL